MNIPNYLDMQVIDPKTGYFTDQWKNIMQQLIQTLQTNASDGQGLVVPTQDAANIAIIQAAQIYNPMPPFNTGNTFITPFGTLLYNSTANILMVALNNLGAPQFHQIVTL